MASSYPDRVSRSWSPADTDGDALRRQVDRWRSMSPGERARAADQMSIDVTRIAIAGIRAQHPDASDDDIRRELFRRRYGDSALDWPPPAP